ncbi:MAG: UDP-N-acetylmuramoyl-tripeptide--D-alanyl-D-alanine ligase [Polyangia bacterium]
MTKPAKRTLAFACKAMGATVVGTPTALATARFAGAASDSREVKPGRLFFALPGERVDGFDFCGAAAQAGAAAVVVADGRGRPAGCSGIPVIAVADPRKALGDLAAAARKQYRGRVVGVTGSNGKTTTKELIAAALSSAGQVLRTQGNLNTDVGLPLTVLEATAKEDFWVLEMAMRAPGEIAYLARIAEPHVAVVTNVAAAHLGRLGSLDAVARAKGEIFGGLSPDGIAVLPVDEPRLEPEVAELPEARKRRFGFADAASARAFVRIMEFIPAGAAGSLIRLSVGCEPVVVRLPLAGEHNARNAAAALAVSHALGVPLLPAAAALQRATLPPHRSHVLSLNGRTVLDDCYNANPTSMSAALHTLVASAGRFGRAFAILGDMLELGEAAADLHQAIGQDAVRIGVAGLAVLGSLGAKIAEGATAAGLPASRAVVCDDPEAAAQAVSTWSGPGDWILVKASRGMRLERAVEALRKKF